MKWKYSVIAILIALMLVGIYVATENKQTEVAKLLTDHIASTPAAEKDSSIATGIAWNVISGRRVPQIYLEEIRRDFRIRDMIVIRILNEQNSDGVFNPASLKNIYTLTEFALKLRWDNPSGQDNQKGVVGRAVLALSTVDRIEQGGPGCVVFSRLLSERLPQTREAARSVREAALANPLLNGTVVSSDGRDAYIWLPTTDKDICSQIQIALEQKIQAINGPERYNITGTLVGAIRIPFDPNRLVSDEEATTSSVSGPCVAYLVLDPTEDKTVSMQYIGDLRKRLAEKSMELKDDFPNVTDIVLEMERHLSEKAPAAKTEAVCLRELIAFANEKLDNADEKEADLWFEFIDFLEMEAERMKPFRQPEVLRYVSDLQEHLQNNGLVSHTYSVADIVKKIHQELINGRPKYYTIPDSMAAVAQCLLQFQASHTPDALWRFVTHDYRKANIHIQLDSGTRKDVELLSDTIRTYVNENHPPVSLKAAVLIPCLTWEAEDTPKPIASAPRTTSNLEAAPVSSGGIPGVNEPILVEEIRVKDSIGFIRNEDLKLLILDAYTKESSQDEDSPPVTPDGPSDIAFALELDLDGPLNCIDWVAQNTKLVYGEEEYRAVSIGMEFDEGSLVCWHIWYIVPRDSEFERYVLRLPDGRGIELATFFEADSKPVAVKFLKVLPSADCFEFSNAAEMFSDKHLKPYAIPTKNDWQRSDMAEVLGRVGAKLEDVLQARSVVEVSTRKLKSNAVILQLPKRIIQKLKNDIEESNFDIRKVGDVEIFAPRVTLGQSSGKMSYALIAEKLITGDADTVDNIVRAFSGAYKGSTIHNREVIRSVWEELPDGFSMTVAIGNEHSYISGLPAISYGESTRKINREAAETVFIANFATSEEADSVRKKIKDDIHEIATILQRDMSVKEVRLFDNMVIVRIRVALKDVTF